MSSLSDLHSFWNGNNTLKTALPLANIYLGFIPPGTTFPYAVLTMLGETHEYTSGKPQVREFNFQLAIYNTDLDALNTLADTIDAQLNTKMFNSSGMACWLVNRGDNCEVENGVYTYSVILEYGYWYNASLS